MCNFLSIYFAIFSLFSNSDNGFYLYIFFMVVIFASPWLLTICGGKSFWWPIVLDVILAIVLFFLNEILLVFDNLKSSKEELENGVSEARDDIEEMKIASSLLHDIHK